jgi:hypothetical protein
VSACGIGQVVSELENAAAKAAKLEKGTASFKAAVTTVTGQVLKVAMDATTTNTAAPAPNFSPLGEVSASKNIDVSVQVDGGTLTLKGTVQVDGTYPDNGIGDSEFTQIVDLVTVWNGLQATSGSATIVTNGDTRVNGTISITTTVSESGDATIAYTGTTTQKGTLTVEGETFDIDVTITISTSGNSLSLAYSGTIDGESFSGSETQPLYNGTQQNDSGNEQDDEEEEGQGLTPAHGCYAESSNMCQQYYWSTLYMSSSTTLNCFNSSAWEKKDAGCDAGWYGTCTWYAGTTSEFKTRYYSESASAESVGCNAGTSGVWSVP